MKIVSKFHDYYDKVLAYGADNDLLMLRDTLTRITSLPPGRSLKDDTVVSPEYQPLINRFGELTAYHTYNHAVLPWIGGRPTEEWGSVTVWFGVVLFCGKPYPFFKTSRSLKAAPHTSEVKFIYDLQELNSVLVSYGCNNIFERKQQERYHRYGYGSKSWFLGVYEQAKSREHVAEATELKAPIILFGERHKCVTYPVLKDIHFWKAVDPWQAYQELSMFLGNIAAPDRCPVTVSEADRIAQHGFDKRYGFRTRPKT